MTVRKIIKIDESKCTGCGLCIPSCAEGALQIVNGKAKLVKDTYCDGLGACLGECPEGALTIIEREADRFDERVTEQHLKDIGRSVKKGEEDSPEPPPLQKSFQCPSAHAISIDFSEEHKENVERVQSRLKNWPIKIELMAPNAPYLQNADLLIAADCAPFACGNFHNDIMKGKVTVIGCPKLNNGEAYLNKLMAIIKSNNLKSVTVAHMEVPCCHGLNYIVDKAIDLVGKSIEKKEIIIGVKGDIVG